MWRCKLCFVFLLQLTLCSYTIGDREQLVKTIRKETDFTPVCRNATHNPITFTVCRIRLVRSIEKECKLNYHKTKGIEQGCDSRFSLTLINQTIFLQLSNLTPENSGSYTCQCSRRSGTFILQLNITVEDDEDTTPAPERPSNTNLLVALIGVPVLIVMILLGVIFGCIYWKKCHRRRREVTITAQTNTEVPDIEPYIVYRENELYLTSIIHTSTSTNNLIVVGMDNPCLGRPL